MCDSPASRFGTVAPGLSGKTVDTAHRLETHKPPLVGRGAAASPDYLARRPRLFHYAYEGSNLPMKPSIHEARRQRRTRIGQATVERAERAQAVRPEVADGTADWHRMLAERMADLDAVRAEARADVRKLAAQWHRQANRERQEGYARKALLLDSAADAIDAWAAKMFSPTTAWPGL